MKMVLTDSGEIPVMEMPPMWYDMIYRQEKVYSLPACESQYYGIYEKICDRIGEDERVFDLGCGTGQLAQVLVGRGRNFVLGVDFSQIAIDKAKALMPSARFEIGDIYRRSVYDLVEYDCVTISEVMEHLEHDLAVVGHIRPGAHIVFTVPNYIAWAIVDDRKVASHVRGFLNESEILARYGNVLEIGGMEEVMLNSERNWKVWIVDSIRRDEDAVD